MNLLLNSSSFPTAIFRREDTVYGPHWYPLKTCSNAVAHEICQLTRTAFLDAVQMEIVRKYFHVSEPGAKTPLPHPGVKGYRDRPVERKVELTA